jgi:hypothetical protein
MSRISLSSRALALLAGACLFSTPTALAQSTDQDDVGAHYSYSYLQVGGGIVDNKSIDDATLLEGRASVGIGGHLYLRGAISDADTSGWQVIDSNVAVGTHYGLGNDIDFLFDLGYGFQSSKLNGVKSDVDGPVVGFGLRGESPGKHFEGEARYSHSWYKGDTGGTENFGTVRLDFLWRTTTHFGVYAAGEWDSESGSDSSGAYSIGLRASL